ncbi:MAG: response regulator transcription factor [Chitinophagaceae bacterium]|nr:response regulator transcription factor [Chitinophagaceae bacterium]
MKILIAEDEKLAAKHLINTLEEAGVKYSSIDTVKSVKELKSWLSAHEEPDLMLLDIQLQDGKSLQVFDEMRITCPVIFITAYDDFLIDSFKANSISYILKPIQKEQLTKAIDKYKDIINYYKHSGKTGGIVPHKERLIVKKGFSRISIPIKNIAFIYSEMKLIFAVDFSGDRYTVDSTLSEIEQQLDRKLFFRVSRQIILNINAVQEFKSIEYSKIEVNLVKNNFLKEPIVVSQITAPEFKNWINSL